MNQSVKKLVGCIDQLGNIISTRFFYVDSETKQVTDVTLELCEAIEHYNNVSRTIRDSGEYAMLIPYEYKYGLAQYSFGCGLTHYLQEQVFEKIEEASINNGHILTFPLSKCSISVFTPDDVKHILNCEGVIETNIKEALKERYGIKE